MSEENCKWMDPERVIQRLNFDDRMMGLKGERIYGEMAKSVRAILNRRTELFDENTQLRARIAELESTSKTYYTKNLALREYNAELEAALAVNIELTNYLETALRPTEGLPTYKELVERVHTEYVRIHDEIINAGLVARSVQFTVSRMFGLDEEQAEQLCTVLNRDPNTGDVIE